MKTIVCLVCSIFCLFSSSAHELSTASISIDGIPRTYLYAQPDGPPPLGGWPVLILFHGAMQQGCVWAKLSRFNAFKNKALQRGYSVIAPDSLYRAKGKVDNILAAIGAPRWNLDDIPHQPIGPSLDYGNNDINFLNALLKEIKHQPALNESQVFLTGFSSGAAFTMIAAHAFTTRIRAVSINSGGYLGDMAFDPPTSGHPPVMINHGTNDYIVNYKNSTKYFEDLSAAGVHAKLNLSKGSGHHWLYLYDKEVLDWFDDHRLGCADGY